MRTLHLLQAKLAELDPRSALDNVAYLVELEPEVLKKTFEENDERIAALRGIEVAEKAITHAFTGRSLIWDEPTAVEEQAPGYDPIYEQEGIRMWIKPVVTNQGICLFLIG
jgi:hypothetical protein